MAAPKSNQFWKLRSKHGRDKLFTTPDILWEAACEYFEHSDKNPLIEIDFRGKDAKRVRIPKMRAYTLKGLCLFLDISESYLRKFKSEIKKDDPFHDDFITVITRIEDTIFTQKFTGAAAGFLNSNIIARDLGLKDASTLAITKVGKDLADETYE